MELSVLIEKLSTETKDRKLVWNKRTQHDITSIYLERDVRMYFANNLTVNKNVCYLSFGDEKHVIIEGEEGFKSLHDLVYIQLLMQMS